MSKRTREILPSKKEQNQQVQRDREKDQRRKQEKYIKERKKGEINEVEIERETHTKGTRKEKKRI